MRKSPLFEDIFPRKKPIIAMLHVFEGSQREQLERALQDLDRLNPFLDGVIVENYGWGGLDSNLATEEVKKRLAELTKEVVKNSKVPVGVNVLPNDYEKAFYVASSAGARFIQMDHVTGDFLCCQSVDSKEFLRIKDFYSDIAVFGGIHPKYYVLKDPLTPIKESALAAEPLTEAVVVTGKYTGGEASLRDIQLVKEAVGGHKVLVGSGLNVINVKAQLALADGAIVGTAFKKQGVLPGEPIDENMLKRFMAFVEEIRKRECAAEIN